MYIQITLKHLLPFRKPNVPNNVCLTVTNMASGHLCSRNTLQYERNIGKAVFRECRYYANVFVKFSHALPVRKVAAE